MDYRFLKAFILTARYSSFSKAGSELRIAQSAVSRQIRKLEESIGSQLFIRSPQSVRLTESGKKLFEHATRFDDWAIREFTAAPVTIRIGTIPGLLDSVLVPTIAKFKSQSSINFVIRADSHTVISEMLIKGELDACLSHTPFEGDHLISKKLFSENLALISREAIRIEDVSKQCWIHMGTSQSLKKISKVESEQFIKVNSMTAIISLVQAGMGIAIVPEHVLVDVKGIWRMPLSLKGNIYLTSQDYEIWPQSLREFWKVLGSLQA